MAAEWPKGEASLYKTKGKKCDKGSKQRPSSGAYHPEHAIPILSLCHVVFKDLVIFRHVLDYYFPWKLKFWSARVRTHQKPAAFHRSYIFLLKCPISNARHNARLIFNYNSSRLVRKAPLESLNLREIPAKNKLVCENALTRIYGSCTLQVVGSCPATNCSYSSKWSLHC